MTYHEAKKLAEDLLIEHRLAEKGWKIEFHPGRRRVGYCCYRTKSIVLSIFFLNEGDHKVKNTILHEIAHALTPGQNHSELWRQVAQNIGCDGKICYDKN